MSARDLAIDELVTALGLSREAAAGIVDRLTTAAAVEAGHRTAEAFIEPMAIAVGTFVDGVKGLLARAHHELTDVMTS